MAGDWVPDEDLGVTLPGETIEQVPGEAHSAGHRPRWWMWGRRPWWLWILVVVLIVALDEAVRMLIGVAGSPPPDVTPTPAVTWRATPSATRTPSRTPSTTPSATPTPTTSDPDRTAVQPAPQTTAEVPASPPAPKYPPLEWTLVSCAAVSGGHRAQFVITGENLPIRYYYSVVIVVGGEERRAKFTSERALPRVVDYTWDSPPELAGMQPTCYLEHVEYRDPPPASGGG